MFCFLNLGLNTLQVADDDFVVIRASEETMGSGGEANRADVTAVGATGLDDASSSDVIQHAGTVLLSRGQQAPAGVYSHRGNCTSCVEQERYLHITVDADLIVLKLLNFIIYQKY